MQKGGNTENEEKKQSLNQKDERRFRDRLSQDTVRVEPASGFCEMPPG